MTNYGDARLPARFWGKVDVLDSGCWQWTASLANGYGRFRISHPRSVRSAHRMTYETLIGEVAGGLDLDHLCRNRGCCNPDHLEPVSRQTNLLRGATIPAWNLTKTHCPQGHPYSGENLIARSRGGNLTRECRTCAASRDRERYAANPKARYYYKPRERVRATQCRSGHDFTPENTIAKANGTRRCRICTNNYQKDRRDRINSTPGRQ